MSSGQRRGPAERNNQEIAAVALHFSSKPQF
jgi:hypothetical protein